MCKENESGVLVHQDIPAPEAVAIADWVPLSLLERMQLAECSLKFCDRLGKTSPEIEDRRARLAPWIEAGRTDPVTAPEFLAALAP